MAKNDNIISNLLVFPCCRMKTDKEPMDSVTREQMTGTQDKLILDYSLTACRSPMEK